jgi:hypothetical protein
MNVDSSSYGASIVLRTPEEVTPALLTELLQERYPGAKVRELELARVHQGTSSHLFIDVTYDGDHAGLPDKLFIKTLLNIVGDLPEEVADSLVAEEGGGVLHRDETKFYREVRPELRVETLNVLAAELLPAPTRFLILAENLTPRGVRFPDPLQPLSVSEVASLLRTLAGLHAQLWASPRLTTGDLAWLEEPLNSPFGNFFRVHGFAIVRMLLEIPSRAAILRSTGYDQDQLEAAFWRLQELMAREPITLLHGDPHPGNLYLLADGTVGLLDWQLVRRGSWAHDMGYATVAALDPADRRTNERDLLNGYLAALRAHGVTPPNEADAWELYRRTPLWGFPMWAVTAEQMYSPGAVEAVMERFATAIVDHDSVRALGL